MSLRASNDTSATPILEKLSTNLTTIIPQNITKNATSYITKALRYVLPDRNATAEELNMAFGDPMPLKNEALDELIEKSFNIMIEYSLIILIVSFVVLIAHAVIIENKLNKNKSKDEIVTLNPINYIIKKYREYKENQKELPRFRPKKAKESPFITAEIPKVLPSCPRLDGAEKGQNILLRYSVPYKSVAYRRCKSSEKMDTEDEHRITITTIVEGTKVSQPLVEETA